MFTHKKTNIVEYEGKEYKFDSRFNTVLLFFELLEDDLFEQYEKVFIGLKILLDEEINEDIMYLYGLFKKVLVEQLDIDLENEKEPPEMVYDFTQDAELIYSSFLKEYGIDLLEDHISWRKFTSLLKQLSDKSPFKMAIGYRMAKIPPTNKYNKEEVKQLRKMKEFYKLEKTNKPKNDDSKLDSVFNAYRR